MSVLVNGPDGANTLFIATGLMQCGFSQSDNTGGTTGASGALQEDFTVILDQPRLAAGQFRKAIASASLAGINGGANPLPGGASSSWYVTSSAAL
jgi:hypothetical protein